MKFSSHFLALTLVGALFFTACGRDSDTNDDVNIADTLLDTPEVTDVIEVEEIPEYSAPTHLPGETPPEDEAIDTVEDTE
jgi:hypothetical protein